jgi:starch-binding outer membrane protein, SusD/RagB family
MRTNSTPEAMKDMTTSRMHRVMAHVNRGLTVGVVAAIALGAASCRFLDDMLDVDAPTQVPASLLEGPEHADLLVNGVIGDFNCALGSYIISQGLLGDELHDGTFTASNWLVPARVLSGTENYGTAGCTARGVYTPMSVARWSADDALRKLDGWTDAEVAARGQKIGIAAAYAGYAHVLLGESMCSVAFDIGPEVTPTESFNRAVARFDRAIASATAANDAAILNMARVGKGRALLNLGRAADASAAVADVPATFVRLAVRADTDARSRNRVAMESPWSNSSGTAGGSSSVAEPYHNLTVGGVADPRVPVTDMQRLAGDALTPLWRQDKYRTPGTAVPIARGAEALLIRAEAAGGQTAVGHINTLRAVHNLPAFSSADEAAIQAQIIEERRREFFLEGHRLGDMRRYNLPFFPATGTAYNKGGAYGDARCFPLPMVERLSNPNIG